MIGVVLLLLLAAAGLAVAALLIRFSRAVSEFRRVRRMTAKLPGPPMYPVIGSALEMACSLEEVYDRLQSLTSTYGPLFRMALAHVTFTVVLHPDDMEAVMTSGKTSDKSAVYGALEPLMGTGLAILGGDVWRRHRKAITPSLHLDILRDFVQIFSKQGAAFADTLAELADKGEVFDVTPLSGACANNAICETVMSSDVDEDDPMKRAFLGAIPKALDHFMYRVWRPWFLSEWAYSLHRSQFPDYVEVKDALNLFTQRIIREKKEALKRNGPLPQRRRQAFLDHVLSSEEGAALSDAELAEEVKTIVTIASGSSMDALTFLIYTLAIRQDIQDKVRQELDDILGEDRERIVQHSDLAHMQYTERVIKEMLRFFSVVPVFARTVTEDFPLPSGFTIPRGCQVAFWLPYVHRNAEWFPEPDKFDPDRFLPDNSRGRHPFAFVPFSAGPRNCIGQRYAMMFLKTVAAAIVPRLRFEVPDDGPKRLEDVPLMVNLTMSVRGGANIRVHRR
ncbi:Cytochrome P450 CYP4 [Frankliniella occidentalis]|uniref:Cytochrome P450 4C1-like n=1 Tax=Frankliniella occidentalis TaxID=133901 RepID=A0A9C6WVI3_FRAOC|nr:cytochrome P450 4C1-like [Frankliniella occidentalis]KAE8747584.1 Cytochrome P450 CYP4 [Frankliniella occidentalis]